jgi:hypothetical protein
VLDFHAGKSALFQLSEQQALLSVPLQVLLLDLGAAPQIRSIPKQLGSALVDLSALRKEVVLPSVQDSRRGFFRGLFPLRDLMGTVVGQVQLVLRVACLGGALTPHLRALPKLNEERQRWVGLGAAPAAATMAAASTSSSADPTAPVPLSTHPLSSLPAVFGSLDSLPRDDTATTWRAGEAKRAQQREQFERREREREQQESAYPPPPLPAADQAPQTQSPPVAGYPHAHAALHGLESFVSSSSDRQRPSVLPPEVLDPSNPATHRAALSLGPAPAPAASKSSSSARASALPTLDEAIARELAHHNLAPRANAAANGSATSAADLSSSSISKFERLVPPTLMRDVSSARLQPQADDYAPPALFFYRPSVETEACGVLEVEYRRAISEQQQQQQLQQQAQQEHAEHASEQRQQQWRRSQLGATGANHLYADHQARLNDDREDRVSGPTGASSSDQQQQQQQHPHQYAPQQQLSFGHSASHPALLHHHHQSHHEEQKYPDQPRSPARSSIRRSASAAAVPLSPSSSSAGASAAAAHPGAGGPITPRCHHLRSSPRSSRGSPGPNPSPPRSRSASSARKLSALERKYRDMEAILAAENRARDAEARAIELQRKLQDSQDEKQQQQQQHDDAAQRRHIALPSRIAALRRPHLSVEHAGFEHERLASSNGADPRGWRPHNGDASSQQQQQPFTGLTSPLPPPAEPLGTDALSAWDACIAPPMFHAELPTAYGPLRPVEKLKDDLPLVAKALPGTGRTYKRAPLTKSSKPPSAQPVRRPVSASGRARSVKKSSSAAAPVVPRLALRQQLQQQPSAPAPMQSTTPFARAFEAVEHMHEQLSARHQAHQPDTRRQQRDSAGADDGDDYHYAHEPAVRDGGGGAGAGRHVQFRTPLSSPPHSSAGQPAPGINVPSPPTPELPEPFNYNRALQPFLTDQGDPDAAVAQRSSSSATSAARHLVGVAPEQFDELLRAVESKLAARSELLYRAREETGPPEFLSPRSMQPHQPHPNAAASSSSAASILAPYVSEASLARVGLNFLNDPSHQPPPSRADMSQFVLRHQLASIHALVTAPNPGASDDPLMASLATKGHVYAQARQAWAAPGSQHRQPQPFQWEENLTLGSS